MKPDTVFIASGIILDKIEEVTNVLKINGLEVITVEKQGEWAAILSKIKVGDKGE
jgi:ribosomal protein L11 methyltransferase